MHKGRLQHAVGHLIVKTLTWKEILL